ncbi:MAG: bacteriophage CI repressor [Desulfobacteraceae bacterium]|nr:bacteriophage CI repressor [Desulfobacteraceae bacterium]
MIEVNKIINRILEALSLKTEKELAIILGISPQDFSQRKKKGTLLKLIINSEINKNINYDWLLTGEGEIYKNQKLLLERTYEQSSYSEIDNKILSLIKEMTYEEKRDILRMIEREKIISKLIKENKV